MKSALAPQRAPTPARSDSAKIVDAIVTAARELGDPEASVNAIAVRAGVGVASLYRYFPSKPAIYAEVSRRLQRDAMARIRAILEQPSLSIEEVVEACCRSAVQIPGIGPALRRSLNVAVPLSWTLSSARSMHMQLNGEIVQWLSTHMTPVPPDLSDRVFVAFAAARGIVLVATLLPEIAPTEEALVANMVRVTLACLRAR